MFPGTQSENGNDAEPKPDLVCNFALKKCSYGVKARKKL